MAEDNGDPFYIHVLNFQDRRALLSSTIRRRRPFNPRFLPLRENINYFNLLSNRLANRLNRVARLPQYPDIREVDDESSSSEEGSSNSDSSSS